MKKHLITLLCFCIMGLGKLNAKTIVVASLDELRSAIDNANAGDMIVVKNGVYKTSEEIDINKVGTAAKPITITTESLGGAEITGKGGFNLVSPAAYIIIRGSNSRMRHRKQDPGQALNFVSGRVMFLKHLAPENIFS
jgi:poly(beta-D-mannuronate) lyase